LRGKSQAGDCGVSGTFNGDGTEPPVHPTGKEFDFWYKAASKASYFESENGTIFAVGGSHAADPAGCTAAVFSKRRVCVDGLPVGTYICLRSRRGAIAEIQLRGMHPKKRMLIGYTTWLLAAGTCTTAVTGSFGITIQATMYDTRPKNGMGKTVSTTQSTRISVTSTPK
jgi:hypothetical protein